MQNVVGNPPTQQSDHYLIPTKDLIWLKSETLDIRRALGSHLLQSCVTGEVEKCVHLKLLKTEYNKYALTGIKIEINKLPVMLLRCYLCRLRSCWLDNEETNCIIKVFSNKIINTISGHDGLEAFYPLMT